MARVEQVLRALNADEQDLIREYYYRHFKCLESAQKSTDAKLHVFLSKKNWSPIALSEPLFIDDSGPKCNAE